MISSIDKLISVLDLAPDYSVETLERILLENLPSREEITAISEAVMPYGRTIIKLTDKYEVIIGCWPRGGWCDAHDHGDSVGIVHSYGGQIEHFEYRLEDGNLELFGHKQIHDGESARLYPGMIHALQNVISDEPYIGLHIYAPPTTNVRVFDLKTGDIYHVTDDAAAVVPKERRFIKKMEQQMFTYRNLVHEHA
jgi:hypothetical protein